MTKTWKKAFKMYMLSENLQSVPKVSFKTITKSKYILRKEPKENYLSTIEAISFALKELENIDELIPLKSLDYIQDFQIKKMGEDRFKRFYLKTN